MAACTTNYLDPRRGLSAQVAERNAELMAQQPLRRRGIRTPEFFFQKQFDNSRLVKAPDPVRMKEMRVFTAAAAVLFSLILVYGLQHFYAIESGYRVAAERQTLEHLREQNRQLRLAEDQLARPGRIAAMAQQYGLGVPHPGQVVLSNVNPTSSMSGQPVMAQAGPPPFGAGQ
jgi:hypothetical protein